MSNLPEREVQILAVHATFIHTIVFALLDPENHPELEQHLQTAEKNGWQELVSSVRKIMRGKKDPSIYRALDDEDRIIIEAILRGLQNPQALPEIPKKADESAASPGLATLILQAARGDTNALQLLGSMADQMGSSGGSMAKVGATLKKLLDGERDIDKLTFNMDEKGRLLIESIVTHLNQKQHH